jgi:DNA replication protein DnaC
VAGEAPWPFFCHGPAGTGKTCAALCLLDHLAGGGEYHTAASLAELLAQAQQGRLTWYREGYGGTVWPEKVWEGVRRECLVVLDELGAREKVSDHQYECVKRLLDERQGRPLVALSNLDLQALARVYDDRIASRLAAGTVLRLEGEDRRLAR